MKYTSTCENTGRIHNLKKSDAKWNPALKIVYNLKTKDVWFLLPTKFSS